MALNDAVRDTYINVPYRKRGAKVSSAPDYPLYSVLNRLTIFAYDAGTYEQEAYHVENEQIHLKAGWDMNQNRFDGLSLFHVEEGRERLVICTMPSGEVIAHDQDRWESIQKAIENLIKTRNVQIMTGAPIFTRQYINVIALTRNGIPIENQEADAIRQAMGIVWDNPTKVTGCWKTHESDIAKMHVNFNGNLFTIEMLPGSHYYDTHSSEPSNPVLIIGYDGEIIRANAYWQVSAIPYLRDYFDIGPEIYPRRDYTS